MTKLHLLHIKSARRRMDHAQAQMRDAIVAAFTEREGHTVEDIAKAAGVTRERVYQIVKEDRDGR